MRTYFLPIKSENLAGYITAALVKPSKYYKSLRNTDVQERYRDFLFLCTKQYVKGDSSDCSIELILNEEEIKALESKSLNSECFLFDKPLPITRIKSIRFKSAEQREIDLNIIRLNTGFIPENLISRDINFETAENPLEENNFPIEDYNSKIENFDRQLGAFALMRLVTQENITYSEHYFSRLAKYNKFIDESIKDTSLANMKDLIFKREVSDYYKNKITDDIIKKVASIEKQKLKRTGKSTYDLESIDGATYILAFIRDHQANENDEGRDKIDRYIINHFNNLKYAEDLAFYYGYNKGYSAFKKSYQSTETSNVDYKYKFETQLDYYTIESIYQYCINDNKSNADFSYLTSIFANQINIHKEPQDNQLYILGELITYKKKEEKTSSDIYQLLSEEFSEIRKRMENAEKLIISIKEENKTLRIENTELKNKLVSSQKNALSPIKNEERRTDDFDKLICDLEECIKKHKQSTKLKTDIIEKIKPYVSLSNKNFLI